MATIITREVGATAKGSPLTNAEVDGNFINLNTDKLEVTNPAYTGTLTGGTGVVNLGSGQFVKDASGNLGVGVTPSAWNSDYKVIQLGQQSSIYGRVGPTEDVGLMRNAYRATDGSFKYATNGTAQRFSLNSGAYVWYTAPSGTAGNPISFTQAMTLDASGNLILTSGKSLINYGAGSITSNSAIGAGALYSNTTGYNNTANGLQALYSNTTGVSNTANGLQALYSNTTGVSNTASGVNALQSNTTGNSNTANGLQALYDVTEGSNNTAIGYNTGRGITTGTGNTIVGANVTGLAAGLTNNIILADGTGAIRAQIDASGNLLVGTTAAIGIGVRSAFHSAHASGAVTEINTSNASYGGNALLIYANRATTDGSFNVINYYNTTTRFVVRDSGNVQNTNNSYGAYSDLKLKENITDASPKLAKLMQVRIVNYNLKSDPDKTKLIGVVAQELEKVSPGLIEETADRDAEGNDLGTTTKSVKYSVFVPMLIKSLQEQQAQIEALEARLAAADI